MNSYQILKPCQPIHGPGVQPMRHWRPVVSEQSLVWPQEQKGQRSVQAKPSHLVAGALQECLQQCGTVMVLLPDTQHWENKALTCVGRARSPWPSAGFLPGPWKRRLCPAVQRETRLSKVILFPDVAEVTPNRSHTAPARAAGGNWDCRVHRLCCSCRRSVGT